MSYCAAHRRQHWRPCRFQRRAWRRRFGPRRLAAWWWARWGGGVLALLLLAAAAGAGALGALSAPWP